MIWGLIEDVLRGVRGGCEFGGLVPHSVAFLEIVASRQALRLSSMADWTNHIDCEYDQELSKRQH